MQSEDKQRKAERCRFRGNIQYEKINKDGTNNTPITTASRDLSLRGISFYTNDKFDLDALVRVKFSVSENDTVTFIGRVVRMEIIPMAEMRYIVSLEIKNIEEAQKNKLSEFLIRINIYNILDTMDLENVTDIHFVVGYPPVLKKTGKLEHSGEPFDAHVLATLLTGILDDERYTKFMREKETNFVLNYKERRLRVNLHVQQDKVEGAFRLIPFNIKLPRQLGLPEVLETSASDNQKGLILIAGRTGSGKTTTLASIVEAINNKKEAIIVCVEDPIEYIHTNKKSIIKQREVGRDTISFASAAKNALRQNPDVLMIGEILDVETMEIVLTASESGTLVLTSIHAPNSSQVLDRIVSFFPPELQRHILTRLSLVLKCVVTQELIPTLDNKGFAVAAETMVMSDALKQIIRSGDFKQIPSIIQTGKAAGMQSMQDAIERLVRLGRIDKAYLMER